VVNGWIGRVRSGDVAGVVRDLLLQHYDPVYAASIRRNFSQYPQALPCALGDRGKDSLRAAARRMLAAEGTRG
jgi:tRNA 2-selenouridine synthase